MITIRASIHDDEPDLVLPSIEALDAALDAASVEAKAKGKLNIVTLSAPNRDWLSLAVGSEETVVGFNYGHGDPPYFASLGNSQSDEPFLTAFVGLVHHTELSRRWVVPLATGRQAARDFLSTGERPSSLTWQEL
jgi:hypothetical protein